MTKYLAACVLLVGSLGCSSSDTSSSSGATSNDAGTEAAPTEDAGRGLPADCANGDEGGAVPSTPTELQTWLQGKSYRCWARESRVHTSLGPHDGNVRVYFNAALDGSLTAKGKEHPVAAVAVKELFGSSTDTLLGWAVSVKTEPVSGNGRGWYWYEIYDVAPTATSALEGQGKQLCSDCHAGGRDYVLTKHPLR